MLSEHKLLKSRTKYWVDVRHISKVKHMILPHLPVYQFDENEYTGDSQLVNSVYLDNSSLEVYHSRLKEDGRSGMVVKLSWYGSQEPIDVHVQVCVVCGVSIDRPFVIVVVVFFFCDSWHGAHGFV